MYKGTLKILNKIVQELEDEKYPTAQERHYMIQGVKIAQQVIKQAQVNSVYNVNETFKKVVGDLHEHLEYEDAVEIINDVYW